MHEGDLLGVQALSVEDVVKDTGGQAASGTRRSRPPGCRFDRTERTIEFVLHHGMTDFGQVHADLVQASRAWTRADERVLIKPLEHLEIRAGCLAILRVGLGGGEGAASADTPERQIYRPAIVGDLSLHEREVALR